jgi:Uri superfamily endonuclease
MKFIALTLFSIVGLVKADQHYSVGMDITIDGATGNPSDPECIAALEAALVQAYAESYPDSDNHLDDVNIDNVQPDYLSTELDTMGKYTYIGSGDNTCRRCKPLVSAAFAGKQALLKAVGTTDDMEAKTLSILQRSTDCKAFANISDLSIEWIRSRLETTVKQDEQHFSVGIDVTIDGATRNPTEDECTAALESGLVTAYAEAYPDSDVHLQSVHFDNVTPDFVASNLGTMGKYTYIGSGDNTCRRCKPMFLSFSSKHELLTAVGTTDKMEAKTLSILQASTDCPAFKKLTDLSIEWVRSGLELDVSVAQKEQHFSVGIDVTVDGAIGNPSSAQCIKAVESVVVSAYAAAYPDSDVDLNSVHFDDVKPNFALKNLRVTTVGKYTYIGSGDNTCRRCKPVLSASYLSKEALLEAVGTSDAFEADILSMLKAPDSSDCNSFKKITDVSVEWVRGGEALDIANA